MDRYICIHGHFYQPPRENPWLGKIEQQDSAYPYHDWNERITEECYAPNSTARILDSNKRIIKIVNNYSKISFNFGPTLLSWLEEYSPEVYAAILQADKDSIQLFAGCGSAIAQAYNHMIMPLANRQDKYTQVLWGIRDFEHRFQRKPLGMWLPETAVDLETLEIMAELAIKFTILAQHQAKRLRKIADHSRWHDVNNGQISPTMPYLQKLASGRSIVIFLYDGPVSQAIAFTDMLKNGENLAESINKIFSDKSNRPELANIATDGETYGHHHPFGDMALAYALHYIEEKQLGKVTNYSQFLQIFPPNHEIDILENTSWSCIHGVERWRSNCGCAGGGNWNQEWRRPLREALDWLRDSIKSPYENKCHEIFKDPWTARNNYIEVILDRSDQSLGKFFQENAIHDLNEEERQVALCLMEMQRHALLMYTSCGWFFEELSRIETTQIISYAARVIQLAEQTLLISLEYQFLERLANAKSNIPEYHDGRYVYDNFIKPRTITWPKIAAHYAITSLFENYEKNDEIYYYRIDHADVQKMTSGNVQLLLGHGIFTSVITREFSKLSFGVLHLGDQNLICASKFHNEQDYAKMFQEINNMFNGADLVGVNKLFYAYFDDSIYSIGSLFYDQKRWVLNRIFENTLIEIEIIYKRIYQQHAFLIRFIEDLGIPLPEAFKTVAQHIINSEIKKEFSRVKFKLTHINKLLDEAKLAKVKLDPVELGFVLQKTLECMMLSLQRDVSSLKKMRHIIDAMKVIGRLPFQINLYHIQNSFFQLLESTYPQFKQLADQGGEKEQTWVENFHILGDQLSINVS